MPETVGCPGMAFGVAVSVQSAGTLPEPDAAASTILVRVSCAGWSSLSIVHVADVPTGNTNELPVNVPAVHDQAPAV